MAQVFLIVEGQSEELYYKKHFAVAYLPRGVYFDVTVMPSKRGATSRAYKGGRISYEECVNNVRRFLRTAGHCQLVALVYDYYGLPPSFLAKLALPMGRTATIVERVAAIRQRLEDDINDPRFHCYLQLHEFEAFLYCAPEAVARHFADPTLLPVLRATLAAFDNQPEAINDHPETAPSKRLAAALRPRSFGKTTDGVAIAGAIGVAGLRAQCPTFEVFCQRLDQLT